MIYKWICAVLVLLTHWTEGLPDTCENDNVEWHFFNSHCYKFVSESALRDRNTWWSSNQLCLQEGAHLTSIITKEENDFIDSKLSGFTENNFWIGGYAQEGTGFQWVDGQPFDYFNWNDGEPNEYLGQEDCIEIFTHNLGKWNDRNCGRTMGRICKRPNGATVAPPVPTLPMAGFCPKDWFHVGITGRCFRFFSELKDFESAHTACREVHSQANLVSIHNAKELAYITAGVGILQTNVWTGLRLQEEFVWVDQSGVTFTAWAEGEPNGGSYGEDCAEAYYPSGLWNDIYCDHQLGYVCSMTQDPNIAADGPLPMCEMPYDQYFSYRGNCFRPEKAAKTWQEAERECAREGGHLASGHDVGEGAILWIIAQSEDYLDPWIGLNNIENPKLFKWTDGWPVYYTNWGYDQPDVNHTDYNCVRVNSEDGLWISALCHEIRPFLCKYSNVTVPTPDPPKNGYCPDDSWLDLNGGYCYQVHTESKSWNDAHAVCLFQETDMASIHSEEEKNLIQFALKDIRKPTWIGLIKKTSGLGWSDLTGFDYSNWAENEPNSEAEQCTEIIPSSGLWNDAYCENEQPFICKTPKSLEPTNPDGGNKLSGGAIFGIILAVVVAVAGVVVIGYLMIQKKNGNDIKLPFSG